MLGLALALSLAGCARFFGTPGGDAPDGGEEPLCSTWEDWGCLGDGAEICHATCDELVIDCGSTGTDEDCVCVGEGLPIFCDVTGEGCERCAEALATCCSDIAGR